MSTVNRLYNFQAGQKIYSQQVDDELDQLVEAHNTNDDRVSVIEDQLTNDVATQEYVDNEITQAMLGNPPLGGVSLEMLDPDIQRQLSTVDIGMANLAVLAEINGISTGQSGYGYDLFTGPGNNLYSGAKMDVTRARVGASIAVGTMTVSITDLSGGSFSIGQEVTLQDVVTDSIIERKVISNIVGAIITFSSPTTKAYAANANMYRSLATVDTARKKLEFGALTYPGSTITATGTTITAAVSSASDNPNARRLVRTPRGWLIYTLCTAAGVRSLYISKDGGVTWSQLCTNTFGGSSAGELAVWGDTVYWVMGGNTMGTVLWRIDTLTQINVDVKTAAIQVTSSITYQFPAVAIDSKGFIHVSGAEPNAREFVYCLSKDGGSTWAESNVAMNIGYAGNNMLLIDKNDNPLFFVSDTSSPYNTVWANKASGAYLTGFMSGISAGGSGWTGIVKRNGSDIGRIIIVSSGTGNWTYSDDNGATWATTTTISIGIVNQTAQLTENSNGDVYLVAHQTTTALSTNVLTNGSTTWSSYSNYETTASSQTPISVLEYATFTSPIAIYSKSTGTSIRGTYTPILSKDVTQVDVRYNITPPTGTMDELRSWIRYDDFTGFTVTSAFSSVNPGAAETFVNMTTDNTDYGSIIETYFEGSVSVAKARNTQKITMTRAATTDNVGLTKYLAAIVAP